MSLDVAQILSISNVNAQGVTVLNDGKLLELILDYPFLYNPRVKAYKDPDYAKWAWRRINAAFNRSYEGNPNAAFSVGDLANRWEVLKPLVRCLSNAFDLGAIPPSLRQSVLKISKQLDERNVCELEPTINSAQQYLLQQLDDINKMPLEKRLSLECEVLDVFLNEELSSKNTLVLNKPQKEQIFKQTEEFLQHIGFHEVFKIAQNEKQKNIESEIDEHNKINQLNMWIPLEEMSKYIKPCCVRVNRCDIEQHMPLINLTNYMC